MCEFTALKICDCTATTSKKR